MMPTASSENKYNVYKGIITKSYSYEDSNPPEPITVTVDNIGGRKMNCCPATQLRKEYDRRIGDQTGKWPQPAPKLRDILWNEWNYLTRGEIVKELNRYLILDYYGMAQLFQLKAICNETFADDPKTICLADGPETIATVGTLGIINSLLASVGEKPILALYDGKTKILEKFE